MQATCNNPPMAAHPQLLPAVDAERREFDSAAGRLSYYVGGPASRPPLLLVHSINAAASVYEMRPLFEHYRRTRRVYALDLPGYGFSERSDRAYTPRLMTDALHAMTDEIARAGDGPAVDALALSLSCEFAARAAVERPAAWRTLGLISPTGFSGTRVRDGADGSTAAVPWLAGVYRFPLWHHALFNSLTTPRVMRYFLRRTWGAPQIDEGLLAYNIPLTRQPGARFAPYAFLTGGLFSNDIRRVYERLTQPVWMVHGVRGDFVDYRQKSAFEHKPNWRFDVLPTGALPHFEQLAAFVRRYESFVAASTGR